ncbi:hypothetical protein O6H91_18G032200 [Diphasiastrum complanatum]|uniref:Uncharacterized protein n=1 Tax=Diphasiastrum complanatum TaxID=34168 RepID=A0ACC2AZN0_DIPCM|nr:hypothetical protein O6H91_18G032200 [Diphasiastrum complanatum]
MASSSLQNYLKRYASTDDKEAEETKKKKHKKKKKKNNKLESKSKPVSSYSGVVIVDDDVSWQKQVQQDTEDEDDDDEEGPQVIEDVEVKVMQKMEAMRMHRPYLSIGDDGSGWVDVSSSVRSDLSPPRRRRHDSPSLSPEPEWRHDSLIERGNGDGSSVRNRRPGTSTEEKFEGYSLTSNEADYLPSQKKVTEAITSRSHHDGDLSPPRKRVRIEPSTIQSSTGEQDKHHASLDLSPPRRKLHAPSLLNQKFIKKDMDLSPPRRSAIYDEEKRADAYVHRRSAEFEASLSVQRSIKSERSHKLPDLSPPRKRSQENDSVSEFPSRKSDSKSASHLSGKDGSREGKRFVPKMRDEPLAKDFSAGRTSRDGQNGAKVSQKRQNRDSAGLTNISPRRLDLHGRSPGDDNDQQSASMFRRDERSVHLGAAHAHGVMKKSKMTDGASAGLRSGNELKEEIEQKKEAEAKRFAEMDPLLSGKGAHTVYRDKKGRRLESQEELLRQQKGEPKVEDEPLEWGKGIAQKREAEARRAELEKEKNMPFARSRDDAELDKLLRERVRWEDPMAHLVKKKSIEPVLEDFGMNDQMKESGFIIPQGIPQHSWLKRGIGPPLNRYGIKPGRHWDGVDRSTGHEKELFKQKNEKKATELEAYLWSVSEM